MVILFIWIMTHDSQYLGINQTLLRRPPHRRTHVVEYGAEWGRSTMQQRFTYSRPPSSIELPSHLGGFNIYIHWISLITWDLGLEEISAISDFALKRFSTDTQTHIHTDKSRYNRFRALSDSVLSDIYCTSLLVQCCTDSKNCHIKQIKKRKNHHN